MKLKVVTLWLKIILLLLFCTQSFAAAKLQTVEVKQLAGKVSLYFVLNEAVPHKAFTLTNPDRIVVDFENTQLAFNLKALNAHNHLIKLVRSGSPKPNTLRLVFEVTDPVKLNASAEKTIQKANHAFSLHIFSSTKFSLLGTKPNNPVKLSYPSRSSSSVNQPVHAQSMPRANLRDVVVVIDPGHGGHDP